MSIVVPADGLVTGDDRKRRCFWGASAPDYQRYHDEEWGFPVADDRRLFEKICLEGFQSGLSWLTILRKREGFRRGFCGFDPQQVARFGAKEIAALLGDAGIVRHRGKIESTINNARRALEVIEQHGSLAAYLWQFEPPASERPAAMTWAALRAMSQTPTSLALSKELKRRGWTFVGPTTLYAFMQAMGLVNDHVEGCWARRNAQVARRAFSPPSVGAAAFASVGAAPAARRAATSSKRAPAAKKPAARRAATSSKRAPAAKKPAARRA